jgi:hypothetical protein
VVLTYIKWYIYLEKYFQFHHFKKSQWSPFNDYYFFLFQSIQPIKNFIVAEIVAVSVLLHIVVQEAILVLFTDSIQLSYANLLLKIMQL